MAMGRSQSPTYENAYAKRKETKKKPAGDWHPQEVIMRNLYLFSVAGPAEYNKETNGHTPHSHSWYSAPDMDYTFDIQPESAEFNKITNTKGKYYFTGTSEFQDFLDIPNSQLSALVPYAKLFKYENSYAGDPVKYELPFPKNILESATAPSNPAQVVFRQVSTGLLDDMLSEQRNQSGCGIVSVNIEQSGSNIATARKIHEVKIVYYFSSMEELFRERGIFTNTITADPSKSTTVVQTFSFDSIISKPASPIVTTEYCDGVKTSPPAFRLYLETGYEVPNHDKMEAKVKNAIRKTKLLLNLSLYKHSVEFNENGSLQVTANYQGFIEERVSRIDVFKLLQLGKYHQAHKDPNELIKATKLYRLERAECKQGTANKQAVEKIAEKIKEERASIYTRLIDDLFSKNRIHYFRAPMSSFKTFTTTTPDGEKEVYRDYTLQDTSSASSSRGDYDRELNSWQRQILEQIKKSAEEGTSPYYTRNPKETRFPYIYLGDIIEVFARTMRKFNKYLKYDFHIALGTMVVFVPNLIGAQGGIEPVEIAISRFPISMQSFSEWWTNHVVRNGDRKVYYLQDFLKDILTGLVAGCFNIKTYGGDFDSGAPVLPASTFSMNMLQCAKDPTGGKNTPTSRKSKANGLNYSNAAISWGFADTTLQPIRHQNIGLAVNDENAVMMITGNTPPFFRNSRLIGSVAQERRHGIYTLSSFASQGAVKSVKFKHSDAKFGKESRMIRGGMSSLEASMWGFYNADVELYGCFGFAPGALMKITSYAFDQAKADKIGLGGYYRVLKVSHKVELGKFTTQLECQWEYSG